jgi:hypothetical protein
MLVKAKKDFSQHALRLWLGKITKMFCETALIFFFVHVLPLCLKRCNHAEKTWPQSGRQCNLSLQSISFSVKKPVYSAAPRKKNGKWKCRKGYRLFQICLAVFARWISVRDIGNTLQNQNKLGTEPLICFFILILKDFILIG